MAQVFVPPIPVWKAATPLGNLSPPRTSRGGDVPPSLRSWDGGGRPRLNIVSAGIFSKSKIPILFPKRMLKILGLNRITILAACVVQAGSIFFCS